MTGFTPLDTETLTLDRSGRLAEMYVLSPFVWREDDDWHMLLRAVPSRDDEPRLKMAEVFYGVSHNGRHFVMDDAPALFPGPQLSDLDGCEDPTVVRQDGGLQVWYTGWNHAEQTGRLLRASGPDPRRLEKQGLALDSTAGFADPKEATVVPDGNGGWRLFFEYAQDEASVIGLADCASLRGPWTNVRRLTDPRPGHWDSWHLSTGPIVGIGTDRPVMFYNGASRDAEWRIGWMAFDRTVSRIVERSDDPVVGVPDGLHEGWTDIAFAASAVEEPGGDIWLYYSVADRALKRVRLRPD